MKLLRHLLIACLCASLGACANSAKRPATQPSAPAKFILRGTHRL